LPGTEFKSKVLSSPSLKEDTIDRAGKVDNNVIAKCCSVTTGVDNFSASLPHLFELRFDRFVIEDEAFFLQHQTGVIARGHLRADFNLSGISKRFAVFDQAVFNNFRVAEDVDVVGVERLNVTVI